MVVTKKLGVRLGGSATSQQVLKMKIDDTPRKREATLESAVWQANSRKTREVAHPQLFRVSVEDKPALYFLVEVAHLPADR
jgi:hypothetical protein